jgi:hypothetical protein
LTLFDDSLGVLNLNKEMGIGCGCSCTDENEKNGREKKLKFIAPPENTPMHRASHSLLFTRENSDLFSDLYLEVSMTPSEQRYQ